MQSSDFFRTYMKNRELQEFINKTALVLYYFQMIEEHLRIYILKKVEGSSKEAIRSKYNNIRVSRDSLGTLINKFGQFNANQGLITELKRLKPERDNIAHRGMLIPGPELNDRLVLASKTQELKQLRSDTAKAFRRVFDECNNIGARF